MSSTLPTLNLSTYSMHDLLQIKNVASYFGDDVIRKKVQEQIADRIRPTVCLPDAYLPDFHFSQPRGV